MTNTDRSVSDRSAPGLEGVIFTDTNLSLIDGTLGKLMYVGYDIHDLVDHAHFEEVCYLLWHGELPTAPELSLFQSELLSLRALSPEEWALVEGIPLTGHGMDALRTLVSGAAMLDQRADEISIDAAIRVGMILMAKMPTLIAAWHRRRSGLAPVAPDLKLNHAANFLYMLHGEPPSETATRAFNTYLVSLAEHGLNASTFAARVAVSAQSDIYAAITAAIGTLKGRLHGGANQKAMETFLAIEDPKKAQSYIEGMLARGGRLMGVGHRIYRVEDPRVNRLRRAVVEMSKEYGGTGHDVADAVGQVVSENAFFTSRKLNPNVEFYSAPLLHELGIPLDLFTVAFALSRIGGWIGHCCEQIADNRLIRPKAGYSGPLERAYAPVDKR